MGEERGSCWGCVVVVGNAPGAVPQSVLGTSHDERPYPHSPLADVVCGMVRKLEDYGVRDGNILGVRYGLRGLYAKGSPKPIALNSSMGECACAA